MGLYRKFFFFFNLIDCYNPSPKASISSENWSKNECHHLLSFCVCRLSQAPVYAGAHWMKIDVYLLKASFMPCCLGLQIKLGILFPNTSTGSLSERWRWTSSQSNAMAHKSPCPFVTAVRQSTLVGLSDALHCLSLPCFHPTRWYQL